MSVGAGSSAATTKPADSSVPTMAAAGPSTRSSPPKVQHTNVSGNSNQTCEALALASRQYRAPIRPSASIDPARLRSGPPGSPKQAQNAAMAVQPRRGSCTSTARMTGAALMAAACRASSHSTLRREARQRVSRLVTRMKCSGKIGWAGRKDGNPTMSTRQGREIAPRGGNPRHKGRTKRHSSRPETRAKHEFAHLNTVGYMCVTLWRGERRMRQYRVPICARTAQATCRDASGASR